MKGLHMASCMTMNASSIVKLLCFMTLKEKKKEPAVIKITT